MKKLAVAVCAVVAGMAQAEESAQIVQLRADLAAAAAGETVVVPAGTHLLESPLQMPAKSIALAGATGEPGDVVLNGNGACRVIVMGGADYSYALTGLTISNGYNNVENANKSVVENGAGVGGNGNLYATNCVFTCCHNEKANGGAVRGTKIVLSKCVLSGNSTAKEGGVYFGDTATGCRAVFQDCHFTGNTATNYGGCVSMDNSVNVLMVSNCSFTANSSGKPGGALCGNVKRIVDCGFTNNVATSGGAFYSGSSVRVATYIEGCEFVGNRSTTSTGSAIYEHGSPSDTYPDAGLHLDRCRFIGNECRDSFAAVYLNAPAWCVSNTVFLCNVATNAAAAAAALRGKVGDLYNCIFSNNLSRSGGTAWQEGGITTNKWFGEGGKVEKCVFVGNEIRGDASYMSGTNLKKPSVPGVVSIASGGKIPLFKDCDFLCNVATNSYWETEASPATVLGVALHNTGDIRLENCRFIGNRGHSNVHGTFNGRSMAGIVGCTFEDNIMEDAKSGGAVLIDLVDTPFSNSVSRLENCTFTRNSPGAVGLSWGWAEVTDCTFASNSNAPAFYSYQWGYSGSADNTRRANPQYNRHYWIDRCTFIGNDAPWGAAVGVSDTARGYNGNGENDNRGIIRNSLFVGNYANTADGGGAIYYKPTGTELTVENCTFVGNSALSDYKNANSYTKGGAVCVVQIAPAITNSLFYMNRTVMENRAASGQPVKPWKHANLYAPDLSLVANCFVANDPDYPDFDYRALGADVHIQNGVNGNIVQDAGPKFVDPSAGDYHLAKGSACINAGANAAWMTGATDLDNNPKKGRIAEQIVDIGCYEYWPVRGLLLIFR